MTNMHPWRRATIIAGRMTDIDLPDELSRLASIAAALAAEMESSSNSPDDRRKKEGAIWLADQLADDLAALTDAFENERKLRAREMEALS